MKKVPAQKEQHQDDSLFGLLSAYKWNGTYFRVMVSDEIKQILVIMTDNPGKWSGYQGGEGMHFRALSRLELDSDKLFLKYVTPEQIVSVLGPLAGIKIRSSSLKTESVNGDPNFHVIRMPLKYRSKVILGVKKLLRLKPHKRYEIIEKSLAGKQD